MTNFGNGNSLSVNLSTDKKITGNLCKDNQLTSRLSIAKGENYKLESPYVKNILNDVLPLTIGGGIGQSRILMLLLEKSHIAEVQASSWEEKTLEELKDLKLL